MKTTAIIFLLIVSLLGTSISHPLGEVGENGQADAGLPQADADPQGIIPVEIAHQTLNQANVESAPVEAAETSPAVQNQNAEPDQDQIQASKLNQAHAVHLNEEQSVQLNHAEEAEDDDEEEEDLSPASSSDKNKVASKPKSKKSKKIKTKAKGPPKPAATKDKAEGTSADEAQVEDSVEEDSVFPNAPEEAPVESVVAPVDSELVETFGSPLEVATDFVAPIITAVQAEGDSTKSNDDEDSSAAASSAQGESKAPAEKLAACSQETGADCSNNAQDTALLEISANDRESDAEHFASIQKRLSDAENKHFTAIQDALAHAMKAEAAEMIKHTEAEGSGAEHSEADHIKAVQESLAQAVQATKKASQMLERIEAQQAEADNNGVSVS